MPKEKIRVVHIITMLELGGAQQNTLYTVEHLDRRRFEVFLIAGCGGILDADAQRIRDLTTFFVPFMVRPIRLFNDLKALRRIRALLRDIRPHIVHTHSSKAGIVGRWAARLSGVPVILHSIHGFGFHDHQPFLLRRLFVMLERLTATITTRFVAVSKANIRTGEEASILHPGDATLIRSGIPVREFAEVEVNPREKRAELHLRSGDPVVGMIACFKPQKAPLDFIHLARLVVREVPEAKFIVAGDGDLRAAMEKSICEKGLERAVMLLGWRRDIPSLLRVLNVLVHTSLWEGLPRVFPQAMTAGVPIVATNVDGASEAVEHGVTGYLVEPHDVEAMARHVVYLLKNPKVAAAMGNRGAARVGEFDIIKMVEQQEALYLELAGPCRSGVPGSAGTTGIEEGDRV